MHQVKKLISFNIQTFSFSFSGDGKIDIKKTYALAWNRTTGSSI